MLETAHSQHNPNCAALNEAVAFACASAHLYFALARCSKALESVLIVCHAGVCARVRHKGYVVVQVRIQRVGGHHPRCSVRIKEMRFLTRKL